MQMLGGKWALVTGSSRGIGQQIALGLAQRGCNVIVHGRELDHTRPTLDLLAGCPVQTRAVAGDLAAPDGAAAVVAGVREAVGDIDILYNNAAIQGAWTPLWETGAEAWQAIFQVNLFALIELCTAFAPAMKRRGYGRIVNLTSGIQDVPQLAPYSVSKAAVDKYSRDLAAELRGSNVLVNYLDPGWLRTDLGGPQAEWPVETVLPGALVPALLEDNGPSGRLYAAQDYKYLA